MILFPAIDIKNGSCVRLVQGKMEEATVFNEDPVDQAKIFESKGWFRNIKKFCFLELLI